MSFFHFLKTNVAYLLSVRVWVMVYVRSENWWEEVLSFHSWVLGSTLGQVPSLDGRLLWELFVVIVLEASSYSVLQYSLELSSHSPQHLGVNLPAVCLFNKFTFDGIEYIHIIAQRIFILQN